MRSDPPQFERILTPSFSVVSQSGNLVSSFLNYAVETGVGVSKAISCGNSGQTTLADYLDWREKFTDAEGQLLPQYQLPPMVASFMQEPETAVEKRKAIPVPKGPVEVW